MAVMIAGGRTAGTVIVPAVIVPTGSTGTPTPVAVGGRTPNVANGRPVRDDRGRIEPLGTTGARRGTGQGCSRRAIVATRPIVVAAVRDAPARTATGGRPRAAAKAATGAASHSAAPARPVTTSVANHPAVATTTTDRLGSHRHANTRRRTANI